MKIDEVKSLLGPLGIPVAYRKFTPKKESPTPQPPFIIFTFPRERGYGADDGNYIKYKNLNIELYTAQKNEILEESLEKLINAFEYDKSEDYIDEEEMYQIEYDIDIYQK